MALPLLPTEVLAEDAADAAEAVVVDAAVAARPERTAGVLRADPTLDGGGAATGWSVVN